MRTVNFYKVIKTHFYVHVALFLQLPNSIKNAFEVYLNPQRKSEILINFGSYGKSTFISFTLVANKSMLLTSRCLFSYINLNWYMYCIYTVLTF